MLCGGKKSQSLSPSVRRMKRKSCSKAENRISEIDQLLNSLLRHSETLLQRSDDRMANWQRKEGCLLLPATKNCQLFANRERRGRREGEECLADLHKEKVWEGGRKGQPTDRRVGLAIQAQVLGKVRCSKSLSFIG